MPQSLTPAGSVDLGPAARVKEPTRSTVGHAYRRNLVARNALWRMLESGGSELLSVLFFVVLGRLLTPADFGLVAIATVFLVGCQVILRTGFGIAIIQRDRIEPAHLNAAFWTNLALATLLSALLIAVSLPVAAAVGEPSVAPLMGALAPVLVLSGAAWIFHARFKREMRYSVVFWSTLASILGGGLAGVLLALGGAGAWSLVGQQVAGALLGLLLLVAWSPWRPDLRFSRSDIRDLASFSARAMASHSLETASQRALPLILAFFASAPAVGLYVIASRLAWALASITMFVIFDLSLVVLSRLHSRPERHREGAYHTLRLTTLLCLPSFVGLALVADPLIRLLFGTRWVGSVQLLQIISVLMIFYALYLSTQQILISAGRPQPALKLAVISAALVPSFTFAAAPFGVAAAAFAAGLAPVVALPVVLRCLRLELALSARRLLADQAPIWLASAAMALCVGLLPIGAALSPLALVSIDVLCGVATFVAVMLILAPGYIREVRGMLRAALSNASTTG